MRRRVYPHPARLTSVDVSALLERLRGDRTDLIDRIAACLAIADARWDGDPQTVVFLDRILPDLTPPEAHADSEAEAPDARARWRVVTTQRRLFGFPAPQAAIAEFHKADAKKGRRLIVRDLDAAHIAAALSWHFEEGPEEDPRRRRSRRSQLRPHLVTSMVVRHDAGGERRAQYTVMLWYLLLVVAAIDRRTVRRGRVGVVADSAIILTPDELKAFGLRRGPSRKHGGYADDEYYELST